MKRQEFCDGKNKLLGHPGVLASFPHDILYRVTEQQAMAYLQKYKHEE
jgi:hypothetical protein